MKNDLMEIISQNQGQITDYYLSGANKVFMSVFIFFSANWAVDNSNKILFWLAAISGVLLVLTNAVKLINAIFEGKFTGRFKIKDLISHLKKFKCL